MQMDTSENKISDNATKNSEEPFDDIEGNIEDSACDAENTDQQSEANEGIRIKFYIIILLKIFTIL